MEADEEGAAMTATIPGQDLATFVGRGDIIIESTQRVKGDNSKWSITYRPNPNWVEKEALREDVVGYRRMGKTHR